MGGGLDELQRGSGVPRWGEREGGGRDDWGCSQQKPVAQVSLPTHGQRTSADGASRMGSDEGSSAELNGSHLP